MENIEKLMPSLEPPIDEVSSYSSNRGLNDSQENTLSPKKAQNKTSSKKRKNSKNPKGKTKRTLEEQSADQLERMKEYIEDRLAPFKLEVSKLYTELSKVFTEDSNNRQSVIIKSIRTMQTIHQGIVKKYAQLKVTNNKNEAKLSSQQKLNRHLEETLSSTIRDKDESYIQLKSEIRVLEHRLEEVNFKLRANNKDESLIEQECRELKERIKDNENLLDIHIKNNKELDSTNHSLTDRLNKLENEYMEYKDQTQKVINSKNSELIDLRSRLAVIDQDYSEKINLLVLEKNKLESTLEIETSESELLGIKLSVLSNKIKTVVEQKEFLLENVESCIDNLQQEWEKLKNNCQRQMIISGEKAVEQLEELLIFMINSFMGVKDVVKFMSFEELDMAEFQSPPDLHDKLDKNDIGISKLGNDDSIPETESIDSQSQKKEEPTISSEMEPKDLRKMYQGTQEKRMKMKNNVKSRDQFELSALVEKVRTKVDALNAKNEEEDKVSDIEPDTKSKVSTVPKKPRSNSSRYTDTNKVHEISERAYGRSIAVPTDDQKQAHEVAQLISPTAFKDELTPESVDSFLKDHWMELMES